MKTVNEINLITLILKTIQDKAEEIEDLRFDDMDEERKAGCILAFIVERLEMVRKLNFEG